MASATFDSEQRKLPQSLTPPASQQDMVSLQKKKALLALGKSSDAAICIPSDVESDTEDENDGNRELNNLQSCATRASTPDYLDLTGTEYGATEPEAITGVVTAPTVSLAQAEAAPAWRSETPVSHLADAEPSQKSCEMNHVLTGHASASQDVNFATPPTSPESQPYPDAADGQELRPAPVSEWNNMMVDAVSGHGTCYDAQGHPNSLSTYTHSPRTASPAGVTQASLEASEAPAGSSHDDAIPDAHTPSPARPTPEPHQGQSLDDASCASSHVESEVTGAGSGSEAEVSSTSPSVRRFRRKSLQMHKTMQSKDGDSDSEGSGSEDGLNGPESQHREENCHSLPDSEDSGSEDDDFDDIHQGRKRRRISKSPSCSVRNAATRAGVSRRRRRSTRAVTHSSRERDTSALGVLSPTPSPPTSISPEASAFARFQEWPLENVSMKRIIENGKTTFQFQFDLPLFSNHRHANDVISDSTHSITPRKTRKRASATRAKYSEDEDKFLIQLKEEEQLGWAEIRRRFADRFPERASSSLQVHYCTKVKNRARTRKSP